MANISITVSMSTTGTSSKDVINIAANNVSVDALAGNDSITLSSGTTVTIIGGAGNDSIYNNVGNNVSIDAGAGNDKTFLYTGSNITVNAGDGNDSVLVSDSVSGVHIYTGAGKDTLSLWSSGTNVPTIVGGSGDNVINIMNSGTKVVATAEDGGYIKFDETYAGDFKGAATLIGDSSGMYTLSGTSGTDLFKISKGDAVISNYGLEDTISLAGAVNEVLNSKVDSIVKFDGGSVRIKNGAGHYLNIAGVGDTLAANSYTVTPKDVIKKFMASLDSTTLKGSAAVDEAVQAATGNSTLTASKLITQMVTDAKKSNFLEDYCGIILNNSDTGAITGSDAGGSNFKISTSIVPEVSDYSLIPSSGTGVYSGLSVTYPDFTNSVAKEQIAIGLNSWWINEGLALIRDSYGDKFSFDSGTASVKTMNVTFSDDAKSGALASVANTAVNGKATTLTLDVNMHYYPSLTDVRTNKDGASTVSGATLLDRTIAHEMTHAVMAANIDNFSALPAFIKEGMAELTHGIDDERANDIARLASKPTSLKSALSLTATTAKNDNYAAGYMFLKYLAKQYSNMNTNISDTTVTGLTYNFDSTSLVVDGNYSSATLSSYSKIANTIDASKRSAKQAIYIVGNDFNQSIKGSKGNDTISPVTGTNTLTGGSGNDHFVYNGNDLVITDYQVGKDIIRITSDVSITSSSIDTVNKNVIITTKNSNSETGTLTLLKAAKVTKTTAISNKITIADANGETSNYIFDNNSNSTLAGSKANDVFRYNGGNVSISDYTINKDVIKLGNGLSTATALENYTVDGKNIVIPFTTDGNNTLTILKGKDKRIDFIDTSDATISAMSFTYSDPSTKVIAATDNSIYSFAADTVLSAESKARIINLDATKRTKPIYLVGSLDSTKNLNIKGGKGADTIDGGKGNSSLIGGKGKDTFIFTGGNDTISDYTAGQDTISIGSDVTISKVEVSSNNTDVVFSFGTNGSLMVQNAIKKAKTPQKISVNENGIVTSHVYGQTALSVANTDGNTINLDTASNAGVLDVDASKRSKKYPIYLIGNSKDNSLKGGAGIDTIAASKGENTLIGGKSGDLFYFDGSITEGNSLNIISDYTYAKDNYDTIHVANATYDNYLVDGNDVIFGFGSAGSIKVLDGMGSYVHFVDNSGATLSASGVYYDEVTIDGSKIKTGVSLSGNSNNNYVIFGKGKDTFKYTAGADTLVSYTAGQDEIELARGNYSTYHVKNSDVVFYFDSGTVATNTLTVMNGKGKKITTSIAGTKTTTIYPDYEETIFAASSPSTILGASAGLEKYVTFNANKKKTAVNITGNNKDNVIIGGTGDDTLRGGAGDNTLTGGKGKDVFVYSGGKGFITDYVAGQDTVGIAGVTYSDYSVSGKDVVMNFGGENVLTIVNGKDKTITFEGSGTSAAMSTVYSDYYEKIFEKSETEENKRYIATSEDVTINAAKLTKAITINGNTKDNVITGSPKNDEIYGASGNDTLNGGKGNDILSGDLGDDYIITSAGKDTITYIGGNDTISDYTAGQDVIELSSGITLTNVTIPRKTPSNLVFTTSNGGSITVVNGIKITSSKSTPQKITIADSSGNQTRQVYGQKFLTIVNADGNIINLDNGLNNSVIMADASKRAKNYPITIIDNNNSSTLTGGKGNDNITLLTNSRAVGGAGNDTIVVSGGNDYIDAGAGSDEINVIGALGNNTIVGGAGNDVINMVSASYSGLNYISYTASQGNDTVTNFRSHDRLLLGSSKTKVTSATVTDGDYVFTIGKGKITLKNISTDTAVTVIDYAGRESIYSDNVVTKATTSEASFIEREYNAAVEDTWFTSVDSAMVVNGDIIEINEIIGKGDDPGIVSSNEERVLLTQGDNDIGDNLTSNKIETGSRLIKKDD